MMGGWRCKMQLLWVNFNFGAIENVDPEDPFFWGFVFSKLGVQTWGVLYFPVFISNRGLSEDVKKHFWMGSSFSQGTACPLVRIVIFREVFEESVFFLNFRSIKTVCPLKHEMTSLCNSAAGSVFNLKISSSLRAFQWYYIYFHRPSSFIATYKLNSQTGLTLCGPIMRFYALRWE